MLWNKDSRYIEIPFEKESELEDSVNEVKDALFPPLLVFSTNNLSHSHDVKTSKNRELSTVLYCQHTGLETTFKARKL